jgi:hypothetical protein
LLSLSSWSEKVHRKINTTSVEILPKELQSLKGWTYFLSDHASDADLRKKTYKPEFVKHFIDIDNYEDFNTKHKIEQNFEAACTKYGKDFVLKNGTLPWATDSTYKVLVENFKNGNWNQAALTLADLGHYVADGFMPFHTTTNYDGQYTEQTGIHARYEEVMIDKYIGDMSLNANPIKKIDNVQNYVFSYLYSNNSKTFPILQADRESFRLSGEKYDDNYYLFIWQKTKLLTVKQLRDATKTLASLIYTAWLEAGEPSIPKSL